MGSHPSSAHDPRRQHPPSTTGRSSPHLSLPSPPRLAFGRAVLHPHHGLGAVARIIIGNSSDDLEWLEAATTALRTQVTYLPIRRSDHRTAARDRRLAGTDAVSDVAYADEQAKAAQAILAGASQHAADRELRRIVGEGRMLRRRCLDRDLELADRYLTHGSRPGRHHRTSSRPPSL